jgi:ATP-dependent Lon protease
MTENMLIPIFPLGVVLLPEQRVPLHIFEKRYKLMIGECRTANKVFGIVYFDGQNMSSAGCTARIQSVLKEYPDGRLDIVTRGERRFYLGRLDESRPYLQASVEYFDDDPQEPDAGMRQEAQRGLALLNQVAGAELYDRSSDLAARMDYKTFSFYVAGNDGFTASEKQRFLEMTSTRKRLRKSVGALSKLVERLRINEEIQRLIGGNGHMSPALKRRYPDL